MNTSSPESAAVSQISKPANHENTTKLGSNRACNIAHLTAEARETSNQSIADKIPNNQIISRHEAISRNSENRQPNIGS
jgi:hypothetical protein